ncbi:MAG: hypothetical protein Q9165_008830 [Trypethelium subeluteriae]
MSRIASVKGNILSTYVIGHDSSGSTHVSGAATNKGSLSTRKLNSSLGNGHARARVVLGTGISSGFNIARSHTSRYFNFSSLAFRCCPSSWSDRVKETTPISRQKKAGEREGMGRSDLENNSYSRRRASRSRHRTESGAALWQEEHKDTKRKARTEDWSAEKDQTHHRHGEHLQTSPRSKVTSENERRKHQLSHGLNIRSTKKEQPNDQKHEKLEQAPKEPWQVQKAALKQKFGGEGWNPRKRLSPDAMEGIRALHNASPEGLNTSVLADQFEVSPEAIRRILKSKWRPNEEEAEARRLRWDKRGEKIWSDLVERGIRPPKKWREMGVGKAEPGQVPQWKQRKDKRLAKKERFSAHLYEDKMLDSDDTPNSSISHRIL